MRAKLERIAAGKIEFDRPVVSLSDSVITLSCRPGEKAEGSFTLSADRPIKGMAYASTSRMTLEHPSFHSRAARIFFSFDARGFWGGEEIEGEFWLVTEAGEFKLPYTVRVEAHQEQEKENYAYFISADPIEPLPEEQGEQGAGKRTGRSYGPFVAVTGETEEELAPEEAGKADRQQILKDAAPLGGGLCGPGEALSQMRHARRCSPISAPSLFGGGAQMRRAFSGTRAACRRSLRSRKLYEYFMRSVPEHYREPFPKNLLLYFQMENTLDSGGRPRCTRT